MQAALETAVHFMLPTPKMCDNYREGRKGKKALQKNIYTSDSVRGIGLLWTVKMLWYSPEIIIPDPVPDQL